MKQLFDQASQLFARGMSLTNMNICLGIKYSWHKGGQSRPFMGEIFSTSATGTLGPMSDVNSDFYKSWWRQEDIIIPTVAGLLLYITKLVTL